MTTPRPAPQREEPPKVLFDEQNRLPLYYQIFLILRARIVDGEYGEGAYLPGERELSETYGVSRITAVRALNELANIGLVVRERGRGTRVRFVASGTVVRGPLLATASQRGTGTPRKAGAQGVDAVLEGLRRSDAPTVYAFDYVPAPAEVAAALAVAPGIEVQHSLRMHRFEGRPYVYLATWVPADLGRTYSRQDLESTALITLLERAGLQVGRIEERVTATLSDAGLSERLDVAIGSPLIKIARTMFDRKERAVEHVIGFYPPDRYQYAVSLTRQGPGHPPGR
jgi:GntR family transcriptional regulator